jgi:ribonuclease G
MFNQPQKIMEKEMIVSSTGKTVEVALLEDGKLVEIHRQRSTDQFTVGDARDRAA